MEMDSYQAKSAGVEASLKPMSVRVLFSLLTAVLPASLMAFSGPDHPEWGPYPPVAPFTRASLPRQWVAVEMVFPIIGPCSMRRDYNMQRSNCRHTGVDIDARKMTPIVAPFRGLLGMKRDSFWIYGDNGWAMLGTHLNDDDLGKHNHRGNRDLMFAPDIRPGQMVEAGQFIGYVGMSGDATGPHLHFELYAPGSGSTMSRIRDPFPSLKRAMRLARPTAVIPQPDQRPVAGTIRLQGCVRKIDWDQRRITFILAAKELPDGKVLPATRVRYVTLGVPVQLVKGGALKSLDQIEPTRTVGFYVEEAARVDGETAARILVSPQYAATAFRIGHRP